MINIITLLQLKIAALTLLSMLANPQIPPEMRLQADTVVNAALTLVDTEMAKLNNLSQPAPQIITPTLPTGTTPQTDTTPQLQTQTQPMESKTTIEIFSPFPTKGINRQFKLTDDLTPAGEKYDEVLVGAICRNEQGETIHDADVTVTTSDDSQNKVLHGTGDITKIAKNGGQETVYYYSINYKFKNTGKHTITFSCNGASQSVDLEVSSQ